MSDGRVRQANQPKSGEQSSESMYDVSSSDTEEVCELKKWVIKFQPHMINDQCLHKLFRNHIVFILLQINVKC